MMDLSRNAHPPVISPTSAASTYSDTDGGKDPSCHCGSAYVLSQVLLGVSVGMVETVDSNNNVHVCY